MNLVVYNNCFGILMDIVKIRVPVYDRWRVKHATRRVYLFLSARHVGTVAAGAVRAERRDAPTRASVLTARVSDARHSLHYYVHNGGVRIVRTWTDN